MFTFPKPARPMSPLHWAIHPMLADNKPATQHRAQMRNAAGKEAIARGEYSTASSAKIPPNALRNRISSLNARTLRWFEPSVGRNPTVDRFGPGSRQTCGGPPGRLAKPANHRPHHRHPTGLPIGGAPHPKGNRKPKPDRMRWPNRIRRGAEFPRHPRQIHKAAHKHRGGSTGSTRRGTPGRLTGPGLPSASRRIRPIGSGANPEQVPIQTLRGPPRQNLKHPSRILLGTRRRCFCHLPPRP